MNIDLLMTKKHELGLVCDAAFSSVVSAVLYDEETRALTLELADMDTIHTNIPVEDDISNVLKNSYVLQIGVVEDGAITDHRKVPLMLLQDLGFLAQQGGQMRPPPASVSEFTYFMKECVTGQPLHRDDLGDESASGSVVGGLNRAVLDLAPHLARQRTLEAAHNFKPAGPAGPSVPGMNMGGGGNGMAGGGMLGRGGNNQNTLPPSDEDDQ